MHSGLFINNQGPYTYEYSDDTPEVDISSLGGPRPDPEWFHIDDHGHFHAFNLADGTLPTLHRDEFGIARCILCPNRVDPHYLAGIFKTETMEGSRSITLTVTAYDRDIGYGERVSFYTQDMFGVARVGGFNFTGTFDGKSVCLVLQCEFMVRRTNDL